MSLNLEDWYLIVVLILTFLYSVNLSIKSAAQLKRNDSSRGIVFTYLLAIILAFWLGHRPITPGAFGDTWLYALKYYDTTQTKMTQLEWGFTSIRELCRPYFEVSGYFTIIALGYFLCTAYAMKKIVRWNAYGGFLLFLGAFSTFSYATNGIRNGLACAIFTVALAFVATDRKKKSIIIASVLSFIALSIHRSLMLPIVCLVCALLIKNRKFPFYFWVASIFIYFTIGGFIGNLLASLGFDDRMSGYLMSTERYASNFKTGFRPDFLLYSVMPILLGYNLIIKKGIRNRVYEILLFTYIFANSVWVMIMDIAFSNRFAYLSWFLYPIVLAYPCFAMNIWNREQGSIAKNILLANVLFTAFMHFIYY